MKALTAFVLGITLAGTVALPSAQEIRRRVSEPTPMDASDPQAVRSAALVKHLLAGEKAEAVAWIGKEGDEEYVKGGAVEKDVEAQIKRLAAGKYRIKAFEQAFGADVLVLLTNDKGDDANVVVRYNGDKRMTGFAEAKIAR